MWVIGFLIGVTLVFLIWLFVLAPGDRAHHQRRLEIVQSKLKKLEEKKEKTTSQDQQNVKRDENIDR